MNSYEMVRRLRFQTDGRLEISLITVNTLLKVKLLSKTQNSYFLSFDCAKEVNNG